MFTKNSFEPFEKAMIALLKLKQIEILTNYVENNMHEDVILDVKLEDLKTQMETIEIDQ